MQGTAVMDRGLLDAEAVCGYLLGEGSVCERCWRSIVAGCFPDVMFGDLFVSGRERPSVPGEVVASVMVLQALEGLSDREACSRLQTDLGWKAAAGLPVTDKAFHPTVLVLWRNRLRVRDASDRIFDAVRDLVAVTGAVEGRQRRVLDSTVLDDAVARQSTVTMLRVQIRKLRRLVPELAGVWVHEHNLEGVLEVDWDDPDDVERLVSELVDDALALIGECEDVELADAQGDALGLLALVAGQDTEPGDEPGRWRIAGRVAADRVVSVIDAQSRHTRKTSHHYRDGYKARVCAEPDTGLITAVDLTSGNTSDADAAMGLLKDEPAGTTVLLDSAYSSGALRAELQDAAMDTVIKPAPLRTAVPEGYSIDDFDIDTETNTVTCPAGVRVNITKHRTAPFGANCRRCSVRSRCTTAKTGR